MPRRPTEQDPGELALAIASLEACVAELTARLSERDAPITELEHLLEEARRSGKRL